MKKGIAVVTYDKPGSFYFLIAYTSEDSMGWGFPKALLREDDDPAELKEAVVKHLTGLSSFKIRDTLEAALEFKCHIFDVVVVEANMNIPVNVRGYETYQWADEQRSLEKIDSHEEKDLFIMVKESLHNN